MWTAKGQLHLISAGLGVVVLTVALLVGTVAGAGICSSTEDELAGFLPLGDLQPPSASDSQAAILDAIAVGLRTAESARSQGDATFEVIKRGSLDDHSSMTTLAAMKNGKLPARDSVVGPTRYQTRWAWDGSRSRYESEVMAGPDNAQCIDKAWRIYDGRNSGEYNADARKASIQPPSTSRPVHAEESWLTLSTFSDSPISSVLAGSGIAYAGRQTVGDTACRRVTLSRESDRIDFWFDDQSCRAKRMQFRSSTVHSVTEVTAFTADGLPSAGRYSRFGVVGADEVWLSTIEWSVRQWSSAVESSALELRFPDGTQVTEIGGSEPVIYTAGK